MPQRKWEQEPPESRQSAKKGRYAKIYWKKLNFLKFGTTNTRMKLWCFEQHFPETAKIDWKVSKLEMLDKNCISYVPSGFGRI